jgi:transposase
VLFPSPSGTRFFDRWQKQSRPHEVAGELAVSLRTVQRLFARFEQHGADAIAPHYQQCGGPCATDAEVVHEFCQLRRAHPRWGAEMLRLELQEQHAELPCARTIQRHLRKAGLQPAPAGRPPAGSYPRVPRAQRPHQGWQTDASEELALKSKQACWLRVVDECSGAFLKTLIFPYARWEHVDRHRIQEAMRQVFAQWGLPEHLRVDNGYPWGSSGDFPPEMALWLMGLGVTMIWIPPACPQQNGVVERAQGTGQNWAEPQTCRDATELQKRCDAIDRRQRECYPYQDRRSRWEVYPQLKHSGRPYSPAWERRHWDLSKVLTSIAAKVVVRHVDCSGSISLYHRTRYVGKPYIGRKVYVSLDPTGPTWVTADEDGRELRTHAADELTAERIRSLSVGCRKGKS